MLLRWVVASFSKYFTAFVICTNLYMRFVNARYLHFQFWLLFCISLLQDILDYRLERNTMLRSRYNQILLRFGFWEFKKEREGNNMYELRSYDLKVSFTVTVWSLILLWYFFKVNWMSQRHLLLSMHKNDDCYRICIFLSGYCHFGLSAFFFKLKMLLQYNIRSYKVFRVVKSCILSYKVVMLWKLAEWLIYVCLKLGHQLSIGIAVLHL